MYKRIICLLLSIAILLTFTGCGDNDVKDGDYTVYYLNMDMTKIVEEEYNSTGVAGEELIEELLGKLQSAPDSKKLRQTIPSNVKVNNFKINGACLYLDFSEEYNKLTATEEVLIRAAIVRTMLQVGDYSFVAFTINSEPLRTHDGTLVGSMSSDSFIENPGEQINSSIETTLTLYFSNSDGTALVKETRTVHYSTNISMEKLIVEQLIEGSKKSKNLATLPSGTKIISVTVVDGVCYVNLDESFKNQNSEVNEEVVLYSIVNSLTELSSISKVQISINGDAKGKLRYTYDLSKMYERNMDLVQQ